MVPIAQGQMNTVITSCSIRAGGFVTFLETTTLLCTTVGRAHPKKSSIAIRAELNMQLNQRRYTKQTEACVGHEQNSTTFSRSAA